MVELSRHPAHSCRHISARLLQDPRDDIGNCRFEYIVASWCICCVILFVGIDARAVPGFPEILHNIEWNTMHKIHREAIREVERIQFQQDAFSNNT